MKYLIYARKSSEDEDRQILSIDSQINELKEIAKKRGAKIIGTLEESKSAKAPGRPIFNQMITKVQSGEADGILCWKLDRLARNPIDGGQISWLLQTGIIKSILTFEKEYLPSDNVLLMNVELGMANQFIRDLSTNTQRGLRNKIEKGWAPIIAPLGYLNDKENKTIIKDPERFDLVRKMWDLILVNNYSVMHISRIVALDWKLTTPRRRKRGGTPITKSSIYRILTNPFYYGFFEYNGKLYKGEHEPMISKDQFWKTQAILREKGKPRPKTHDFAFTGLIRCGECGCAITAEEITRVNKTDSNVRHYVYYRCTKKNPKIKCKQSYIQVQELEKYVDEFLATIELDEDFVKLAEEYAIKENKFEGKTQSAALKKLHLAKEDIQAQLTELTTKWLQKKMNDEDHEKDKTRLEKDEADIDEKIRDAERNAKNWLQLVKDTIHFSRNALLCFKNGTLDEKKIILKTIGSNLVLKDKVLQIEPEKLFKIVAKNKKTGNWQRGRDSNP